MYSVLLILYVLRYFITFVESQISQQLPERPLTTAFGEIYWEPIDERFDQCYVHCPASLKQMLFKCWKVPSGFGNLCQPAG